MYILWLDCKQSTQKSYCIYPKYVDRYAKANIADPDQRPLHVDLHVDVVCTHPVFLDTSTDSKMVLFKLSDKLV